MAVRRGVTSLYQFCVLIVTVALDGVVQVHIVRTCPLLFALLS